MIEIQKYPVNSLRLLLQASLGVLIGVLCALMLAGILFPVGGRVHVMTDDILPWTLHDVLMKPREKGFYLSAIMLGSLGAYFATKKIMPVASKKLLLLLILMLPVVNFLAKGVLQHDKDFWWLSVVLGIALLSTYLQYKRGIQYNIATKVESKANYFSLKYYLFALAIIIAIVLPASFTQLAAHIGMEMHVVSFLIAPSLYFLGDHLLPGIDYFTQYSIGLGWVFSKLLANTAELTMVHYTQFLIAAMVCFYAQLLAVLYWLYRHCLPAVFVTIWSLMLLFHTKVHFFDPSSTILRYPLLATAAGLFGWWFTKQDSLIRLTLLGFVIAASLFLNTETGIITAIGVSVAYLIVAGMNIRSISLLTLIGIEACIWFSILIAAIFGVSAFQVKFFQYLLEPLYIYGKTGFGGWLIAWNVHNFNWFYNLISPTVTIATLVLVRRSVSAHDQDKPRLAVLAFFAVCGLLMLVKYINMSIVAVWHMNALGVLVVIGWWLNGLANQYQNKPRLYRLIWSILATLLLVFLLVANDKRNHSVYALRSWLRYPSFIGSLVRPSHNPDNFNSVDHLPSARDVALITARSKEHEQIAMIDMYDWTYLINAARPPLMFFLPSPVIFTKRHLDETMLRLKKVNYLFLTKGASDEPEIVHPDIKAIMMPTFHREFIKEAEGDKLVVWRRRAI